MTGNFWTVEMMIFLPSLMNFPQVDGTLRVGHCRADLGVLPDGVLYLPVEDEPVCDDDDRVEHGSVVPLKADELVSQPSDGVALAAARRVLDQVAAPRPVLRGVGEQSAHHVELVVARPHLRPLLPAGLLVPRLYYLDVVLQDVRQAPASQYLAP